MAMELWFTEKYPNGWGITFKINRALYSGRSKYQRIDVLETVGHGRLLVIDGCVMLTEADEFVYHEMLTHVPLFTHPNPRRVLVIGGGDGGAVREILRHSTVEQVVLVDIDEDVIKVSREFFPTVSCSLDDPRVEVLAEDGVKFLERAEEGTYDVIVVDSTDPVGPAVGLFERPFFEKCFRALTPSGVMAAQSGSPYFQLELVGRVHRTVAEVFPHVRTYIAGTPSYGGMWTFVIASKGMDPIEGPVREEGFVPDKLRYYNYQVHRGAFALPNYIERVIKDQGGT